MTTEHTVVRSGKLKRKPLNSNVVDYLLIIATFELRDRAHRWHNADGRCFLAGRGWARQPAWRHSGSVCAVSEFHSMPVSRA